MAQLVKTVGGLAIASVKTVMGLAVAAAKTINGLDNTSGGGSYDADAQDWIDRIEIADSATLETAVADAMNQLVLDLKAASMFSALGTACFCGARTLAGSLEPLVSTMPTPSNVNLTSSEYDRGEGWIGNGSTMAILTNYQNATPGQNDRHFYVRVTAADSLGATASCYIGTNFVNGGSYVRKSSTTQHTVRISGGNLGVSSSPSTGGYGVARQTSTHMDYLLAGTLTNAASTSATPVARNTAVLAGSTNTTTGLGEYTNARIGAWTGGAFVDLDALDDIVGDYLTALAAAGL